MNDKVANPNVVRSKAATVVMSLAKESRLSEVGQGDGAKHVGREKENQDWFRRLQKQRRVRGPWLTPDWKWRSSANVNPAGWKTINHHVRTWQRWSWRDSSNWSSTVPNWAHMGDPAHGYMEMVKTRNSREDTWWSGTISKPCMNTEGTGVGLKPEEERIWHCDVIGGNWEWFGASEQNFTGG